jgi:CTP:molybdopterin cytidylyltransferase MocA
VRDACGDAGAVADGVVVGEAVERSPQRARVAALVLAAGEGSRFKGGPKLLAPFRCRPLLAWAVASPLDAGLPVVIVRGAVDLSDALADFGAAVTVVDNAHWVEGQATSLGAGIAWCDAAGFDAVVVGLGDQPLVPSSAWRAVADADLAPIVSASFRGRKRPPVRLDRRAWPLLCGIGDEGARELMRRRPDLVAAVACEGDPIDIDTVEDLEAQERREDAGSPGSHGSELRNEVGGWS